MATPPQDPTPRLRALDRLFSSRMKAEDQIISGVIREMLSGSRELSQRVQRRILRLDIDQNGNIKQTDKNLREVQKINLLLAQGGNVIINKALRELKADTSNLRKFYFNELLIQSPNLTQKGLTRLVDANQTRAVLNTNLDNLKTVGASFIQEVRRQLESTLFEEIGPEEMAKRLNQALVGKKDKRGNPMTRHGETIARTAYNGYANALGLQNVNLNDVVAYYYSGPEDNRNRSFCARRVEKTWPRETLEADIANQPGGTIHNPGGFNCRHKLFPISKFDEEAKPFLTNKERIEIFGE